jgi:HSP20 family protein
MPLIRFDPFREFDRMVDQAVNQARQPSFPMDAYRHGDTVVVHFDLPGVDPDSIDIEYERQVLTVSAERTWRRTEGDQLLASERVHGRFQRQILLGEGLDTEGLTATYEHGVLTVAIPVAERSKPRKINVEVSGGDQRSISSGAEPVDTTAS